MNGIRVAAALSSVAMAACAVRLGGPSPEEYRATAWPAAAAATAEATARDLSELDADIVLLAADRDSAWFAQVAEATELTLSGPGRTGDVAQGFLTRRLELLGDTSIVLNVDGGGRLHMHDALYQISEGRYVDLMLIRIDRDSDLRGSVRTLLSYIATDVGPTAAVVFGLHAQTPAAADSVAVLLRAAYGDAWECAEADEDDGRSAPPELRLLYGPPARTRCVSANVLSAPGSPVAANLVVGR